MPDDRVPFPPSPNLPPADDDTEPLVFDLDDEPAPETEPQRPAPAVTQSAPRAPQPTLPGSGGMDPNPDWNASRTVPAPPRNPAPASPRTVVSPTVPSQSAQPTMPRSAQQPTVPRPAVTQPGPTVRTPQGGPSMPNPGAYPPPGYPMPPRQAGPPLPPPRRPVKKKRILGCSPGCLVMLAGMFAAVCGGVSLIALILTATLGTQLEQRLNAQVAQVDNYDAFQSSFYYDRTGALLYESFNEGRRTNIPYQDFPQDLVHATIAIEDDTFFSNPGFEPEATARAFLQYVGLARGSSGGSTITQQLVRNVLFEHKPKSAGEQLRMVFELAMMEQAARSGRGRGWAGVREGG